MGKNAKQPRVMTRSVGQRIKASAEAAKKRLNDSKTAIQNSKTLGEEGKKILTAEVDKEIALADAAIAEVDVLNTQYNAIGEKAGGGTIKIRVFHWAGGEDLLLVDTVVAP